MGWDVQPCHPNLEHFQPCFPSFACHLGRDGVCVGGRGGGRLHVWWVLILF